MSKVIVRVRVNSNMGWIQTLECLLVTTSTLLVSIGGGLHSLDAC